MFTKLPSLPRLGYMSSYKCHLAYVIPPKPFSGSLIMFFVVCYSYMDDLLIASTSTEQHLQHVWFVLECLSIHGIVINPHKSFFGVAELDFFGHRINNRGITPLQDKFQAARDFPLPQSQHKLRQFI